jgi:deoxyribodipyrimidine photo-lyase
MEKESLTMKYGIHWFRRDLRVAGNPALFWNHKAHEGRVLGIFVFDPKFLARTDFAISRFAFFIQTLCELKKELKALGGDLLVLDQGPDQAFQSLFSQLKSAGIVLPSAVTFNRDYEPFARQRDAQIESILSTQFNIPIHSERDHLLIEPHEINKGEPESWYQVYSPFQKKWMKTFYSKKIQERLVEPRVEPLALTWRKLFTKNLDVKFSDQLENYREKVVSKSEVPLPPAGHAAALERLEAFSEEGIQDYAQNRDIPFLDGTSRLSIYLKNGSISSSQVIEKLGLAKQKHRDQSVATQNSRTKFLNELIWREFYYHILYHSPRVENEAFQPKYQSIDWENDPELFQAWCEGRTGYPIVDAAMRQLNTTGWMHNRMRMVVASFLTKDLLISWQWGERHFMQKLLDGDLAANNGGWQWAASTGCDPQPYFRIFNPTLQGKRYDPEGDYVRRFVPELADVSARHIHEPWKLPSLPNGYPKRIVDHSSRSLKAVSLFKRAASAAAQNSVHEKPKSVRVLKSKRPKI